jgi:hypothetical protein
VRGDSFSSMIWTSSINRRGHWRLTNAL